MPTDYTIDHAQRLVISRAWGAVTLEELEDMRVRLAREPGFDPMYRQLFDLRDVVATAFVAASLEHLAATSVFQPGVRRAFLAQTATQLGLARTFEQYSEPHNQLVSVFKDLEEAFAWLDAGAPPPS